MINAIPGGAGGLDQLVCDNKTLSGSAIETKHGKDRFVAQRRLYARELGVALAQKTYETMNPAKNQHLNVLQPYCISMAC
jgi:hypothetical protein